MFLLARAHLVSALDQQSHGFLQVSVHPVYPLPRGILEEELPCCGASASDALFSMGSAASGTQMITGTALEIAKAVGSFTPVTLNTNLVRAGTPMILSFTGRAGTMAGAGHLEVDYIYQT
mgnify:CR=1 FL=1